MQTHKKRKTSFKLLRKVSFPRPSPRLAELLGIVYGDGHVGTYQVSVTTSSVTDLKHAQYTKELLEQLFRVPVSLTIRKTKNVCIVLLSSREVSRFFASMGMPIGNKIAGGIQIPAWVQNNSKYRRALLRGLVDTDGSVYQDKHRIKGADYTSTCIAFTSASPELTAFVRDTLASEGYTVTGWGRNLRVRRRADVFRYAKEIGFGNPKHARKIDV